MARPSASAGAKASRALLAATASVILMLPAVAGAQGHGGGGPGGGGPPAGDHGGGGHGGGGGGHGGGSGGGASPHGGGGPSHGGGGGVAHGGPGGAPGGGHGGFGGGPAFGATQFSGHTFRGYDGSEQRDEHGNFGDRRGFGDEFSSAHRYRSGGYQRPDGWYAHHWRHGEILPPLFWAQDYWLLDYWLYGLSPPPYGYVWVRDGADSLLISRATGEIVEVIYGVFY
jgi:Ni/Co efflux regulator RcnB